VQVYREGGLLGHLHRAGCPQRPADGRGAGERTAHLAPGVHYVTLLLDGEHVVKRAVKVR
jgi:hypothetical protein